MPKEEYLSKKYEKWSNFADEDSDEEQGAVPRVPTQFEVEGDEDIVVSTETLVGAKQIEKIRKLDQTKHEVWQVVVRKLRVWSASSKGGTKADGSDSPPCRPYCIMVNNLYPLGQVVTKKICDPPEEYPSPQTILDMTLACMLDPPSNAPQHRPEMIAFPDKNFVGKLRKSYQAIGIECSFLTESEGIDAYVRDLSNHLVKKDLAAVAEVSERSGMISGAGVTPELLGQFYEACAHYTRLEPWNRLAERQAIQIDAREEIRIDKRHTVNRGTIFSSVISTRTAESNIHGLALFFTRADLERRVLPSGETLALLENPELRRCGFCDKKAAKGAELKRCTRCKCTFYCGAECQRAHWKDHKLNCIAQTGAEPKDPSQIQWGAKEISVLFGSMTTVPFDDLDAIDKHNFKVGSYQGTLYYPSAVVFKQGDPEIPDVSNLLWLTRALRAQVELLEKHPLFLQSSLVEMLDLDGDDSEQKKIEIEGKTLGFDDHLVVRNSMVLTTGDVERIRTAYEKQKVGGSATETEKKDEVANRP
uniref:MYND-type domain-containing protein n=1 Tax=Globisporangium ultimum (strain ATCC 200006 / CBS 805.95 / DAOM BR144) TaxID=431595 RepID=K3WSB4_GLOUD